MNIACRISLLVKERGVLYYLWKINEEFVIKINFYLGFPSANFKIRISGRTYLHHHYRQNVTRSKFRRITAGLNLEFSFDNSLTKAKEPNPLFTHR